MIQEKLYISVQKTFLFIISILFCQIAIPSAAVSETPPSIEVLWELSLPQGFSAPNLVSETASGKTLGIAVAKVSGSLLLIKPNGDVAWEIEMQPPLLSSPAVHDLDADGRPEIVMVDRAGRVVCANIEGQVLWEQTLPDGISGWGNPAAADVNKDGNVEIIVGDRLGNVSCLSHKGELLWRFQGEPGELGTPLLADIYDLPGLEIITTSHGHDIYALGCNGDWLWDIHVPSDLFPNSTPVLADLNGTGKADLIIGGGLNHLVRVDLQTAEVVELFDTLQHINDAISAGDLTGSGSELVLAGNKSGNLYAFEADSENRLRVRWQIDRPAHPIYASPLLLNLDEDPDTEILFLTAKDKPIEAIDPDDQELN